MNKETKDKLNESISLRLEEIDANPPGSVERFDALKDLKELVSVDITVLSEENDTKVELARARAKNMDGVKAFLGKTVNFVADNAIKVGTIGVSIIGIGMAYNADVNGEMINKAVLTWFNHLKKK